MAAPATILFRGANPSGTTRLALDKEVREIDGHDLGQIDSALAAARKAEDRPQMILARTVKGKGVSFMEGMIDWHGKAPKKDEADKALGEISG